MDLPIELLRETEEGAVYRVSLPRGRRTSRPAALEFTLTPQGALTFDNRQPGARLCERRRISLALAEAMTRTARARFPAALAERSPRGTARELRVHSRAYALGIKRSHSVVTELGSPNPAAPDYDDNALWFERPLRSLPAILRAVLKK